jgi:predicted Fe-Mo cluster-binding NifX family protein
VEEEWEEDNPIEYPNRAAGVTRNNPIINQGGYTNPPPTSKTKTMKIAITATENNLDANVDPRFGRAAYFLITDTETLDFKAIENPSAAAGGGAGIKSAQLISDEKVEYLLTGNCGPNAFKVFEAAKINVIVNISGTVRNAIEDFNKGAHKISDAPNVESHHGK